MNEDKSRAERIHQLLRQDPHQPASSAFSIGELKAALTLSGRSQLTPLPADVSLQEATRWVSQAGRVDAAQSIDVTENIALQRGLANVALYVGLSQGQGASSKGQLRPRAS